MTIRDTTRNRLLAAAKLLLVLTAFGLCATTVPTAKSKTSAAATHTARAALAAFDLMPAVNRSAKAATSANG